MKKILMIMLFILFFFINNINVKAYWKFEPQVWVEPKNGSIVISAKDCEDKKIGKYYDGKIDVVSGASLDGSYNFKTCYKMTKHKSTEFLSTCIVTSPITLAGGNDPFSLFAAGGNVIRAKDGSCPDGYFTSDQVKGPAWSFWIISIGEKYIMKYQCIPCANNVVGTKQSNNGDSCYIQYKKVNTCPSGYRYDWSEGKPFCYNTKNRSDVKYINQTSNNFDNTFDDGTKVCPDGYMMAGEYCYQCSFIDDKPDKFNKDCSVFVEVTRPIWRAIRIVAPILAVVLGAFDFLKATAASDEKEMKKATSNFVKRIIMLALLFLLTYIVNFIVGLANGVDLGDITKCL